jgi:hypothetical protein
MDAVRARWLTFEPALGRQVEPIPDRAMVVEVEPAGKSDPWAGRQKRLRFGTPAGGEKVAAVDQGGRQSLVADL